MVSWVAWSPAGRATRRVLAGRLGLPGSVVLPPVMVATVS